MKKITYKILRIFCIPSFLFIVACNTFESEPIEWNTEENAMNPKDSAANNMKDLFYATYSELPTLHTRFQGSYLDASTDDGVPTRDKGGTGSLENYRNGSLSSGNIASLDGNAWKKCYKGIRKVNLFLQKIEGYPSSTQLPADQIVKMKAEARALRAFYYFELIKRWGGVPIIYGEVFDLDSDWSIARSELNECVEYILSEISPDRNTSCYNDLFEAMSSTTSQTTGIYGRINKGTVLGILSRMKLYLASPLYNNGGDVAKWKDAADAALAIISLNLYDLHPDYLKLFGDKASFPNKEVIMVNETSESTGLETSNSPCGYLKPSICQGLTSPSQNLVDAFLTIDGKTIDDPTSGYDSQNPYKNRDPRLQYTIFYNESRWLKRGVQTYTGGLDRSYRPGMIATQTGYYLRKFLGLNEEKESFTGISHNYLIIRYAEILLNYAEALNEIDMSANKTTIEDCIIKIRHRAGINPGSDTRYGLPVSYTQSDMRKIIRNERRIELAFEDQRFWDIRRWKIADAQEAVMTKPVRGVVITKQSDDTFRYEYVDVRTSTFQSRMYWYPIPRGEMQGNTKLVQNPGWNY